MASQIDMRLPKPLDCANLAKEWPKWKQQFLIYLRANNRMNDDEEAKIATFLWLIGDRGLEIYNTLFPNNGEMDSMFGQNTQQQKLFDAAAADAAAAADFAADAADAAPEDEAASAAAAAAATAAAAAASAAEENRQNTSMQLKNVLEAFNGYCLPKKNLAMESFKFHTIVQKEKQIFAEFETELRTQLQYCEFECGTCKSSYADRQKTSIKIVGWTR